MKCDKCVLPDSGCKGERLSHLCGRDDYREFFRANPEPIRGGQAPGLVQMAGNLARAGAKQAHHVAKGGEFFAPQEVQAERKRICLTNHCGHCVNGGKGCTACGCGTVAAISFIGLDMDEKRSWASSVCPLDPPRWGAL